MFTYLLTCLLTYSQLGLISSLPVEMYGICLEAERSGPDGGFESWQRSWVMKADCLGVWFTALREIVNVHVPAVRTNKARPSVRNGRGLPQTQLLGL